MMYEHLATGTSYADDVSAFQIQWNRDAARTGVRGVVVAPCLYFDAAVDNNCWVISRVTAAVTADGKGDYVNPIVWCLKG